MTINSDKPHLWKADVAQSIDFYNDWFLRFAPNTYRKQRVLRTNDPLLSDLEKKQLAALIGENRRNTQKKQPRSRRAEQT